MLYYKVKHDAYDYLNKYAVVKNELLTARERNIKCRYLSDDIFEPVNISKNNIFWFFGARFECGSDPVKNF